MDAFRNHRGRPRYERRDELYDADRDVRQHCGDYRLGAFPSRAFVFNARILTVGQVHRLLFYNFHETTFPYNDLTYPTSLNHLRGTHQ